MAPIGRPSGYRTLASELWAMGDGKGDEDASLLIIPTDSTEEH